MSTNSLINQKNDDGVEMKLSVSKETGIQINN